MNTTKGLQVKNIYAYFSVLVRAPRESELLAVHARALPARRAVYARSQCRSTPLLVAIHSGAGLLQQDVLGCVGRDHTHTIGTHIYSVL